METSFKMSGKGGSVEHEGGIMSFQFLFIHDVDSSLKVFRDSGISKIELFDVFISLNTH